MIGENPQPFLRHFAAAFRSVERHRARRGPVMASINAGADGRVVRRIALAATVGDAIVPTLALDMLRVASGDAGPRHSHAAGTAWRPSAWATSPSPRSPTAPCGSTSRRPIPRASSPPADVLAGAVDPRRFERKLVLVGVTAVGLGDRHATPVAPRMAGVEIHAQLLEGIFDGALLARPRWARWAEAALLALGGGVLILAVPAWPAGRAALLALAVLGATLGLGFLVYRQDRRPARRGRARRWASR